MLTDEQLTNLQDMIAAGQSVTALEEAYRLGYQEATKRAAEVCRTFPLPHAPNNQLANDIALAIEREGNTRV